MTSSNASAVKPSTREAITARQLARLNQQGGGLELLRAENAFYRHKLDGVSLPLASLEAFWQLPFTTKEELVRDQQDSPPYGRNLTYPLAAYTRIHATSGTTGRRLKCLDTNESWSWFTFCWQEIYRAFGITAEDRVFAAFGFGPFVGFWAGFEAAQQIGALAIPGGAQNSLQRLDWLMDAEATVVLSTPTYALRLAEVARENDIDLAASPVHTTIHAGEPGASLPSTRRKIESAWGASCRDHAGMSEMGAWGYECRSGAGLHVLETEFIAEVLEVGGAKPVAEGEIGELVLSNLGRWAMPAIRYRTGDLVQVHRTSCACGSVFARFPGGVLGRVDDMIQVRGVNIYPSAVEAIIREFEDVVEFQVEVFRERAMWEMRASVELAPNVPPETVTKKLEKAIQTRLGIRADVSLAPAGALPRFELKAKRFTVRRHIE